jgi:hypothetical protein
MGGPMRLHEFEDPGGIEPVSRANQAAAFFKNRGNSIPNPESRIQNPD